MNIYGVCKITVVFLLAILLVASVFANLSFGRWPSFEFNFHSVETTQKSAYGTPLNDPNHLGSLSFWTLMYNAYR